MGPAVRRGYPWEEKRAVAGRWPHRRRYDDGGRARWLDYRWRVERFKALLLLFQGRHLKHPDVVVSDRDERDRQGTEHRDPVARLDIFDVEKFAQRSA